MSGGGKDINQVRERDVVKEEGWRGERRKTQENTETRETSKNSREREEEGTREQTTKTATYVFVTVSSSFSFGKRLSYWPPHLVACYITFLHYSNSTTHSAVNYSNKTDYVKE